MTTTPNPSEAHAYVPTGVPNWRTCALCGRGANASIHRAPAPEPEPAPPAPSESDYYYTGAPIVNGHPVPSDGCIVDGSHLSDDYLSARIIDEAHAYGMPRPERLSDSFYWLTRLGERASDEGDSDKAMRYWERAYWASESALSWLNDHAMGAVFYIDESCLFVEFPAAPPIDELAAEYWVCTDCYFAHHYGVSTVDREPTDDELHDWRGGYLRDGHTLPNVIATDSGALMVREWFAGDSDIPCEREPLSEIPTDHDVSDWTDSETGEGEYSFSHTSCDGCGSNLAGARYRLAVWAPDSGAYWSYWRACVAEACDAFTVAMWRVHGRPCDALGTGAQR